MKCNCNEEPKILTVVKIIQPLILSSLMMAGSLQAAVLLSITDSTPLTGDPGDGTPDSGTGTVASNNLTPTNTYTWTGADLTSLGATETGGAGTGTITFTVLYEQTGGTGITNISGKVSVTGGASDNRINDTETLTATITLTGINGYSGIDLSDLSIGFTNATLANFLGTVDTTTESGTVTTTTSDFDASSFITIAPQTGGQATLTAYTIEISSIPEPSVALLACLGLLALLRRRRIH